MRASLVCFSCVLLVSLMMQAGNVAAAGQQEPDFATVRQAAEQENAEAQYTLGVMYATGRGVVEDERQTVEWFRRAAEQGHDYAQCNLGIMYETGRGVAKDERKAVALYKQAAAQGDENAKKALERLKAN